VGQRKCFAAQGDKTPEAGPAQNTYLIKKRVIRAFSVTTGNMLRSPASQ